MNHDVHVKRGFWQNQAFFFMVSCAVILLPLIFFPMSHDLSMFVQGGRTIASGGRLYSDFIDLKPPFIYYFYAGIDMLFGTSEITVRSIDFAIQMLLAFLIYKLADNHINIAHAGGFSAVIYCIAYVNLSFGYTTEVESLIGLPLCAIILLQMKKEKSGTGHILQGLASGLIFSMKFPLALVVVSIIIDKFSDRRPLKKILDESAFIAAGFVIAALIFSLPFADSQVRQGYMDVMKFLSQYSSTAHYNASTIRETLKLAADFFGYNYSILFIVLTSAGIYYTLNSGNDESEPNGLLKFCCIMVFVLFLTIVIEGKYFIYHFSRMYLPLSVIAGSGLALVHRNIYENLARGGRFRWILISGLTAFGLIFSPLPKLSKLELLPVKRLVQNDWNDNFFGYADSFNINDPGFRKNMIGRIKSGLGSNDKVLIVSGESGALNNSFNCRQVAALPNSYFYLGKMAIHEWKKKIIEEMCKYKFIVVQTYDSMIYLTGQDISSWGLVNNESYLNDYIKDNFDLIIDSNGFKVFRRKAMK